MLTKISFGAIALGLVAAPLSAQIRPRIDPRDRTTTGTVIRSDGSVVRTSDGTVVHNDRKIPPGHLPPRGMCRVWIDGVPPGHQPAVTDCVTAERTRVANSRVIYGDRESFRGRGKGKFKNRTDNRTDTTCRVWDAVVVEGRVVNVCRDDNVLRDRRNRDIRHDNDDDDDNNNVHDGDRDDHDGADKFEHKDKSGKVKAHKNESKGKHGRRDH